MTLYVAYERMQEYQARALLHAADGGVACRARHTRAAVKAGYDQHLKRRGAGQIFFDVTIDSLEVIAVATVLVSIIIADTPAVDVPLAVDGDSGWFKL